MTYDEMMDALRSSADPAYAAYQRKIVCDTGYPLLFVRMPELRKIVKAVKEDHKVLADACTFSCYEEVMAVGLAVAGANAPLSERLLVLRPLVDRLDSWGLTDSIVPTLAVKPEELPIAWEFAVGCIRSDLEYVRRFGIVMLLHFFLIPEYLDAVVDIIVSVNDSRYYVQMACAWILAEMAVKACDRVLRVLAEGKLDLFVHSMTIRKIRESLRISNDVKAGAATLRRKEEKNV